MCLKNLIAMVVTTIAFASSLANASAAEFAANSHRILDNGYARSFAANNKANTGAAAPSQPSKTNENTVAGNVAAAPSRPSKTDENTVAGNVAAAPSQPADTNVNPAGNGDDGSSASNGGTEQGESYHHNTSIYKDDGSLWRVEYYDDNNRLCEYSDVDNYDKDTHSYTETVYRYDEENDVEIPVRTDTYVNGELVSSVYY